MKVTDFAPTDNYSNHRALLWLGLEETAGDVLELGMGHSSTPFLHEYCQGRARHLWSIDSDLGWTQKFAELKSDLHHVICCYDNWDSINFIKPWSVVLVDHAPGERRHVDVNRLKDLAEVIVIHDTEPAAEEGYLLYEVWPNFKSKVNVRANGAWASAVSNKLDLRRWVGRTVGKFEVS